MWQLRAQHALVPLRPSLHHFDWTYICIHNRVRDRLLFYEDYEISARISKNHNDKGGFLEQITAGVPSYLTHQAVMFSAGKNKGNTHLPVHP